MTDQFCVIMGWRDILRPIRDGLRDNLPSPPPKEDKKRTRQRELDVLKGFAYFHTFNELDEWRSEDVLPVQQANTPLLPRPSVTGQERKAKITLIHDYAGNYQDYERCQGSSVKSLVYTLDYGRSVDTFVYFSHKVGYNDHCRCISFTEG